MGSPVIEKIVQIKSNWDSALALSDLLEAIDRLKKEYPDATNNEFSIKFEANEGHTWEDEDVITYNLTFKRY